INLPITEGPPYLPVNKLDILPRRPRLKRKRVIGEITYDPNLRNIRDGNKHSFHSVSEWSFACSLSFAAFSTAHCSGVGSPSCPFTALIVSISSFTSRPAE